jgi:hypothetical protein
VLGVKDSFTAGQRLRPPLRNRTVVQPAERRRCSAGRRHAPEVCVDGVRRREDDGVVAGPGPAAARWGVTQRNRSAAGHGNLLQLATGKKPDPLTVRGEERARRALGAGEQRRLQLVERADEESSLTRLLSDEGQRRAVLRQYRRRADFRRQQRGDAEACAQLAQRGRRR